MTKADRREGSVTTDPRDASTAASTTEPRRRRGLVIDLGCGGGGGSVGWWLAGWDVIGVDWLPQEHYPFPMLRADYMALDLEGFVRVTQAGRRDESLRVVVAASPPCQLYSVATPAAYRHRYPDLVPPVRERLATLFRHGVIDAWVLENVPGAPMPAAVQLCGGAFGLGVRRHRLFESSHRLQGTPCRHGDESPTSVVGRYGGPTRGRSVTADQGRAAMGAPWMPWPALTQSIPPAYTEHLGRQLAASLELTTSGNRHLDQLRPRCRCGVELRASVTGRWPRHCSQRCRQAAYRARTAAA